MKEAIHIILLILGFAAVLVAAYYATRVMGSKMSMSKGSGYIKIVDRVYLGNDKSICIIQVGSRFFVVGVTNHHIGGISEIAEGDLIPLSPDKDNSFNNMFEMYMNKFRNNKKDHVEDSDGIRDTGDSLENQKESVKRI